MSWSSVPPPLPLPPLTPIIYMTISQQGPAKPSVKLLLEDDAPPATPTTHLFTSFLNYSRADTSQQQQLEISTEPRGKHSSLFIKNKKKHPSHSVWKGNFFFSWEPKQKEIEKMEYFMWACNLVSLMRCGGGRWTPDGSWAHVESSPLAPPTALWWPQMSGEVTWAGGLTSPQ